MRTKLQNCLKQKGDGTKRRKSKQISFDYVS